MSHFSSEDYILAFGKGWQNPEYLGITHGCGNHSDGNGCEGSNAYGQHNLGSSGVVVGGWHTCYRRWQDDSIQCVGRNDSGQTTVPPGRYHSVDAGREHTCAVTFEGRLRCWGADALGQSSPPGGSDYFSVSSNAFANFNCAKTHRGKVRCWGDNRYGQLNVPAAIAAPSPLAFTQEIKWINSRKGQPIGPFVLPPATGGEGHLSYNIAHTMDYGERQAGPPAGLVFNETTRRLSGRPLNDADTIVLFYSVSDTSGRTEEVAIWVALNGPVPVGYTPAITATELGTLDRDLIRCGIWSEESRVLPINTKHDVYTFRLTSPTQLTIDLESYEADPHLYLSRQDSLEEYLDDNGGQGINSRLIVDLMPARYALYAYTADDQGKGAYTLRIRSPDFPADNSDTNRSCPDDSGANQDTTNAGDGMLDSDDPAGRIVARRLDDGRTEFAWHVEDGERVLPRQRYLPPAPPTGRWLNSSYIVVEGINIGQINVRVRVDDGRIEFAFTPAGGERILPRSRYFPSDAATGRWLRSTLIEPGG